MEKSFYQNKSFFNKSFVVNNNNEFDMDEISNFLVEIDDKK